MPQLHSIVIQHAEFHHYMSPQTVLSALKIW